MNTGNTKKGVPKENRKRIRFNSFKFIRMICLTLVLLSMMSLFFKTTASGFTGDEYKVVTVQRGDTLWEISKNCSNNENIQKVIHEIKKINNLEHSGIYPGQKIKIPINF